MVDAGTHKHRSLVASPLRPESSSVIPCRAPAAKRGTIVAAITFFLIKQLQYQIPDVTANSQFLEALANAQ